MVQQEMLTELARRTRPDGYFYFRTDDRPYFDWTIEHLEESRHWVIDSDAPWPHEKETYFQGLMETYFSVVARLRTAISPHLPSYTSALACSELVEPVKFGL